MIKYGTDPLVLGGAAANVGWDWAYSKQGFFGNKNSYDFNLYNAGASLTVGVLQGIALRKAMDFELKAAKTAKVADGKKDVVPADDFASSQKWILGGIKAGMFVTAGTTVHAAGDFAFSNSGLGGLFRVQGARDFSLQDSFKEGLAQSALLRLTVANLEMKAANTGNQEKLSGLAAKHPKLAILKSAAWSYPAWFVGGGTARTGWEFLNSKGQLLGNENSPEWDTASAVQSFIRGGVEGMSIRFLLGSTGRNIIDASRSKLEAYADMAPKKVSIGLGTGATKVGALPGPQALLSDMVSGSIEWIAISPAFTVGGAFWNAGFDTLGSSIRSGRLTKVDPYINSLDENGNNKKIGLFSQEGSQQLLYSALDGPKQGFWMKPGLALIMPDASAFSQTAAKGGIRGEIARRIIDTQYSSGLGKVTSFFLGPRGITLVDRIASLEGGQMLLRGGAWVDSNIIFMPAYVTLIDKGLNTTPDVINSVFGKTTLKNADGSSIHPYWLDGAEKSALSWGAFALLPSPAKIEQYDVNSLARRHSEKDVESILTKGTTADGKRVDARTIMTAELVVGYHNRVVGAGIKDFKVIESKFDPATVGKYKNGEIPIAPSLQETLDHLKTSSTLSDEALINRATTKLQVRNPALDKTIDGTNWLSVMGENISFSQKDFPEAYKQLQMDKIVLGLRTMTQGEHISNAYFKKTDAAIESMNKGEEAKLDRLIRMRQELGVLPDRDLGMRYIGVKRLNLDKDLGGGYVEAVKDEKGNLKEYRLPKLEATEKLMGLYMKMGLTREAEYQSLVSGLNDLKMESLKQGLFEYSKLMNKDLSAQQIDDFVKQSKNSLFNYSMKSLKVDFLRLNNRFISIRTANESAYDAALDRIMESHSKLNPSLPKTDLSTGYSTEGLSEGAKKIIDTLNEVGYKVAVEKTLDAMGTVHVNSDMFKTTLQYSLDTVRSPDSMFEPMMRNGTAIKGKTTILIPLDIMLLAGGKADEKIWTTSIFSDASKSKEFCDRLMKMPKDFVSVEERDGMQIITLSFSKSGLSEGHDIQMVRLTGMGKDAVQNAKIKSVLDKSDVVVTDINTLQSLKTQERRGDITTGLIYSNITNRWAVVDEIHKVATAPELYIGYGGDSLNKEKFSKYIGAADKMIKGLDELFKNGDADISKDIKWTNWEEFGQALQKAGWIDPYKGYPEVKLQDYLAKSAGLNGQALRDMGDKG
ncbi:MAG: hypothetical protein ACM3OC_04350, partial [Deltaproteobacteria bacterium]